MTKSLLSNLQIVEPVSTIAAGDNKPKYSCGCYVQNMFMTMLVETKRQGIIELINKAYAPRFECV